MRAIKEDTWTLDFCPYVNMGRLLKGLGKPAPSYYTLSRLLQGVLLYRERGSKSEPAD